MGSISRSASVAPGEGACIDLGLARPMIKLGALDGSTQIGLVESELPPGGGFAVPHWHDDLDEVFYVLEGEIEYLLHDSWMPAPAGTTVFVPARPAHAFRNATDHVNEPSRRHRADRTPQVWQTARKSSARSR